MKLSAGNLNFLEVAKWINGMTSSKKIAIWKKISVKVKRQDQDEWTKIMKMAQEKKRRKLCCDGNRRSISLFVSVSLF